MTISSDQENSKQLQVRCISHTSGSLENHDTDKNTATAAQYAMCIVAFNGCL